MNRVVPIEEAEKEFEAAAKAKAAALPREITPEEHKKLRAPFPRECYGKLPKALKKDSPKGKCQECGGYHGLPAIHLDYIGHATVTDRLLEVDLQWTWEPVAFADDGLPRFVRSGNGNPVGLWIKLTVCGVTRYGYGSVEPGAFEPEKQLIGDALRNAAMRFGVALDLWAKAELESAALSGDHDAPKAGKDPKPPGKPQDAPAPAKAPEPAQPASEQPAPPRTPAVTVEVMGLPVDKQLIDTWAKWRGFKCITKADSKSPLKAYSWEQAAQGARDGGRHESLSWFVETAKLEMNEKGTAPSAFSQKCAIVLARLLKLAGEKDALAKEGGNFPFDAPPDPSPGSWEDQG